MYKNRHNVPAVLLLALLLLSVPEALFAQRVAVKTNALSWATTTPNLGVEVALAPRITLAADWGYNPWTFSENRKLKHWQVRPEVRWWFCEAFMGHFAGLYGTFGEFNAGGVRLPLVPDLKNYRYEGNFYDVGLSYGYQWALAPRWNLEASLGVGYRHMVYRRYECPTCGLPVGPDGQPAAESPRTVKHFFGPTRAALSLIFIIK